MMITLEQVEKLVEKANITYDEAKAALEAADGNLLDALIELERQGKVRAPKGGGYYNSQGTTAADSTVVTTTGQQKQEQQKEPGWFHRLLAFCGRLLEKGNANTFEVYRGQNTTFTIPVTILILLFLFCFWVTLPLLIIGLFFGYKYRFCGPDLGRQDVNRAMDSASEVAENIKQSFNSQDNERTDRSDKQ